MRTLARNGLMRALYYFPTDDIRKIIKNPDFNKVLKVMTQPTITCSKLTIETLEQGVKYVQS